MTQKDENDFGKNEWVTESQQAREFTLLYGKSLGFTEEDIRANQAGELTAGQKKTILKKGWWAVLLILIIIVFSLKQILPFFTPPVFLDDAIIFTILTGGMALFMIGTILISFLDAKNLLALFEKKVERKEGIVEVIERTTGIGKSRATRYYLGIGFDFELQIPHRTFSILKNNLHCRLYYTPRIKYLASVEVLNSREFQNATI